MSWSGFAEPPQLPRISFPQIKSNGSIEINVPVGGCDAKITLPPNFFTSLNPSSIVSTRPADSITKSISPCGCNSELDFSTSAAR